LQQIAGLVVLGLRELDVAETFNRGTPSRLCDSPETQIHRAPAASRGPLCIEQRTLDIVKLLEALLRAAPIAEVLKLVACLLSELRAPH
jgi:hypothetical protein